MHSLTIFKDYVETVNASNPHGSGPISLDRFAPFSKNPKDINFVAIPRAPEIRKVKWINCFWLKL